MLGTRYEAYAQAQDGLPFVLHVGIERTRHLFSKETNWHENIEIQFCTQGDGTVLLDGNAYPFGENDIAVVNTNVIHYTGTDRVLTYDCLIIGTAFCEQMQFCTNGIQFAPVIKDPAVVSLFTKLKSLYLDTDTPHRIAKLHTVLLQLMITLTENHSTPVSHAKEHNKRYNRIKPALIYIRDNYHRKITLDDIAKAVLCDKYTLCKDFKTYTGQTVFEHLHRYRCMKAIDFLNAGHTVGETATLCGFENFSFFTKTFKKYIGNLPSAYKK